MERYNNGTLNGVLRIMCSLSLSLCDAVSLILDTGTAREARRSHSAAAHGHVSPIHFLPPSRHDRSSAGGRQDDYCNVPCYSMQCPAVLYCSEVSDACDQELEVLESAMRGGDEDEYEDVEDYEGAQNEYEDALREEQQQMELEGQQAVGMMGLMSPVYSSDQGGADSPIGSLQYMHSPFAPDS